MQKQKQTQALSIKHIAPDYIMRVAARLDSLCDMSGGPDDCMPFKGRLNESGYGCFVCFGHKMSASRAAWLLKHGEIAAGMCVCHNCPGPAGDRPECCNPKHLWLGSRAENNRDRQQKGRSAVGVRHGMAKLNDELISEIRELGSTLSQRKLAKRYGVCRGTIIDVLSGRTWQHVA